MNWWGPLSVNREFGIPYWNTQLLKKQAVTRCAVVSFIGIAIASFETRSVMTTMKRLSDFSLRQ